MYSYCPQLIMSWASNIDETVKKTKVESVDSGVLKLLLEQVTELQADLDVILREFISLKEEAMPLTEAINLDKFLRKLKLTLKHLIS